MLSPSIDKCFPVRWPATWTDPALLGLLKGTTINCVLDAPKAVAGAATADGLAAMSSEEAASQVHFVADPQWPGVRPRRERGAGADAGPTGAPWVDANGWSIRLAQALDPGKPVWVEAVPEKGTVQNDAAYLLAMAESQAFGARWVISFDEGFSRGLAAGDARLITRWGRMMDALRFFAAKPAPAGLEPCASLAVISGFSGDNEFLGKEFLNMADRRNLLYRIVVNKGGVKEVPAGTASAVFIDEQKPDAGTVVTLEKFVRDGGLLIASLGSGLGSLGQATAAAAVPGYTVRTLGKGKVFVPAKAWADPYVLATEVRILIGRRTDVLRIYNEGMVGVVYERGPNEGRVQLVNYARFRSSEQITIATAEGYKRADAVSLEQPAARDLKVTVRPERFTEVPVPSFAVYSAIELRRS